MAIFKPFKAFRPKPEIAGLIASKPYDVLNSAEAREEVKGNPLSFLRIGKPEVDLDPNIDHYDKRVYEKGRENLMKLIDEGHLVPDEKDYFYLYSQTMNGRTQYGLVGCAAVEDYWKDVIKKHEKTRAKKEEDRCNHVRVTNAHTGPIFLTYRDNEKINSIVNRIKEETPENDHIAIDGVRHCTWLIKDEDDINAVRETFASMPNLYVADGHHRSAAAAIVGKERKEANPHHKGDEEYNYFLAVCFPASELYIMDYNRVVKDLHNLKKTEFFSKLREKFVVEKVEGQCKPQKKGEIGLYIDQEWFKLTANDDLLKNTDPVEVLDVAILQREVLTPLLNIDDPRTSDRIDFIGGIRGLDELERRVNNSEMRLAFSMYPTSIDELIDIADAGKIMPPKSTWFEPKLRDGLFVHFLD